ncbi:uncharacterized protein LOC113295492 [Papaver somniferum]|uniref:uncharacterized protein LOC113295492 n=1 Tax=Papaver somniferum TaxID=3469 RepID=UPI000E6F5429|nr:uncharacterized protein LOC113295492 [Papaver somniferum]
MAKAKEDEGLGLRNMEQVNVSLVAKLVWRFLTNADATWVKLYNAKYLQSVSFWDCNPNPGDSKTWKDMLSVKEIFINNCCWSIGSGSKGMECGTSNASFSGESCGSNLKFNTHIQNICPLCHSEEGYVHHLLFSCQFSKAVFQESPLNIDIQDGVLSMEIIQQWLEKNDQGIMLNLGSCILWNIWKMRNDKVFNITQPLVPICIRKALEDFKFFDLHHALNFCSSAILQRQNSIQWNPPPPFYIKINVDAAYNNGRGAASAVARDSYGLHLGSGAFCFDSFSSTVAEAKAYGLGLQLARRLQFSKIIVEGDAEEIPKAIIGNMNDIPWNIRSTVLSIHDRVKDFSEVSFLVVPRDANSIAHDLVQFAISNFLNRWWVYDVPPNCIMQRLISNED